MELLYIFCCRIKKFLHFAIYYYIIYIDQEGKGNYMIGSKVLYKALYGDVYGVVVDVLLFCDSLVIVDEDGVFHTAKREDVYYL